MSFGRGGDIELRVTRLVPDLDDELCRVLDQVEEVLLTLAEWESDPDAQAVIPAALAERNALGAVHRTQDIIGPTQNLVDERGERCVPRISGAGAGRVFAPDRSYEHRPLRIVEVETTDLEVLAKAAAAIGLALAVDPHSELADAITAGVDAAAPDYGPPPEPADVVAGLARVLGVLDLAVTADTRVLSALLNRAGGADIVLNCSESAAYERLADRFNALWAADRGVVPFLY